jgi:regulator of sigma E protease
LIEKKGEEVEATILRDTSLIVTTLSVNQNGNIGVYFSIPNVQRIKYSFAESIPAGLQKAYDATIGQIKDMRLLAKPSTGAYKSVGSVIAITEAMPQQWNWYAFIHILAMISIILAVMNLLPIPALDGGHIVFTLYEMITGRKPSDRFLMIMQMIGMILIFGLMFLAFGNDIARLMK